MSEPRRLQESGEIPDALREAFGALGREAPAADTVLRVQRALQTLPSAVPAAAAVGWFGLSKLLVVVTLAVGAGSAAVMLRSPAEPRVAERAQPALPVPVVARPAMPAREEAAAGAPQSVSGAAARAQPDAHRPSVARPGAEYAQGMKGRVVSKPANARVVASPLPATSAASSPAAEPPPAASLEPASSVAARPSAVPSDEAERLAQCKRIAARQPEQALQQLVLLARDLPNGVFLQERELLAIRLHERLGHRATAEQLLRLFRERYPGSVYQRALPR